MHFLLRQNSRSFDEVVEEAVELATYYPPQNHFEVMLHSHDFVIVAGGDLVETVVDQLAELVRKKASPSPLALRHQSIVLHPSPESPPHRGSGGSSPHPQMTRTNVVSWIPLLIPSGRSDSQNHIPRPRHNHQMRHPGRGCTDPCYLVVVGD